MPGRRFNVFDGINLGCGGFMGGCLGCFLVVFLLFVGVILLFGGLLSSCDQMH